MSGDSELALGTTLMRAGTRRVSRDSIAAWKTREWRTGVRRRNRFGVVIRLALRASENLGAGNDPNATELGTRHVGTAT
jgi:hypothetical protein